MAAYASVLYGENQILLDNLDESSHHEATTSPRPLEYRCTVDDLVQVLKTNQRESNRQPHVIQQSLPNGDYSKIFVRTQHRRSFF